MRTLRDMRVALCLLGSLLTPIAAHAQADPLKGLDAYIGESMALWQAPDWRSQS